MSHTESQSKYDNLEKQSIKDLLQNINKEDKTVPIAVEKAIPQIEKLTLQVAEKMKAGGRLFYIGAGTSGRLGVVDASECPPTFGVSDNLVIGLIAGGDKALRKPVEAAEDDTKQAWKDLKKFSVTDKDVVIGIAASGITPYVVAGVEACVAHGITTGCITCNLNTKLASIADFPIEVIVGAEFITGSTRMKAGTAQKLVLNMISTAVMIQLGRIKGNKMVEMQLTNNKLLARGTRILMQELNISESEAKTLLKEHKNVRKAIEWYNNHA